MNHFSNKNYFTMPNEIFSLGRTKSFLLGWAQVRSRSTPTFAVLKIPAPTSAGPATQRSEKLFTLRTYTHATRQMQQKAAEKMGSFMAQIR